MNLIKINFSKNHKDSYLMLILLDRISRQKNKETLEEVWEVNLQFSSGIQTKSIIGNGMKKKTRKI